MFWEPVTQPKQSHSSHSQEGFPDLGFQIPSYYPITPHATLFHWDSPQALEDRYGSWRSREIASDFADYATAVVSRLGDRITHWMTLNEISQFTHLGYGVNKQPNNAPGTRVSSQKEVWQTSHGVSWITLSGVWVMANASVSFIPITARKDAFPKPALSGMQSPFVRTGWSEAESLYH